MDKILFFASGDFANETMKMFVETGMNIAGLVTTNGDLHNDVNTIADVARNYGIPTYTLKSGIPMEEDRFLIDWIKRANADVFCVISFKKLPKQIIDLAHKCAFNVHASVLPLLRGAAPINWALRNGFKETGLTAILLNDKIDQGDILGNTVVKISEKDNFKSLYAKLSKECVDFTGFILLEVLTKDDFKKRAIKQIEVPETFKAFIDAPKIDKDYYNCYWSKFTFIQLNNYVRSADNGIPAILNVHKRYTKYEDDKQFDIKIQEIEEIQDDFDVGIESDGKSYIRVNTGYSKFSIKRIQLSGKKAMDVKDFLNGFNYFRDKDYTISILETNYFAN